MTFRTPHLKRAIKVAQDMGLPVSGYEIGPGGEIRVLTTAKAKSDSDAALDRWMKSRGTNT